MASKCKEGTTNNNCKTKQTFCIINGQHVKDNSGITKNLNSITQYETLTTADIWNRIKTVLTNIHNYGERGTKNPTVTNISTVTKYDDEILLSLYNTILSSIDIAQASGNPTITKQLMDNLQGYIDNYLLNNDRCNSCNTACNTSCEAADQCAYTPCDRYCWNFYGVQGCPTQCPVGYIGGGCTVQVPAMKYGA